MCEELKLRTSDEKSSTESCTGGKTDLAVSLSKRPYVKQPKIAVGILYETGK